MSFSEKKHLRMYRLSSALWSECCPTNFFNFSDEKGDTGKKSMDKIERLLRNRNFIFYFVPLSRDSYGGSAHFIKDAVIPILALSMIISTTTVLHNVLSSLKLMIKPPLFTGVFLNYVFHGSLLLLIGSLLIENADFWKGFMVIAAVPPAIAIIPFSIFLKGDSEFALFGS